MLKQNVLAVMNNHITTPIDRNFVSKVLTFVQNFTRKDNNHIAFFGGNLVGVYSVKYTTQDRLIWVEDVLNIEDFVELTTQLHALPDIEKNFNVSSDTVNLTLMWVAHKGLTTPALGKDLGERLAHAAISFLLIKFITSLHSNRFHWPANEQIALAVYEQLSKKFQLKQLGSWQALIDFRAAAFLAPGALHSDGIRKFDNDLKIVRMLNDIQSGIRSTFNTLYGEFKKIKEADDRIASTTKFMQVDGEAILKDHINKYAQVKSIIKDILPDPMSFVREDIISVVLQVINTVYPQLLRSTLLFMSHNSQGGFKISPGQIIDDILMFIFDIIKKEKIPLTHLSDIAMHLKGVLRSSRLNSPEYKMIKENLDVIIQKAVPGISETNTASTRIGVVMYIVLRALVEIKK